MKKINYGKRFESDFQKSASMVMNIDRLKDPPQSFNSGCQGCPKQKTRFSPRNLCDFIGFKCPDQYYFELKSHKGKSVPFSAIVAKEKDTRLKEMVQKEVDHYGVFSYVIFNWRDCGNDTFVVPAVLVYNFIQAAERKSIPYDWTEQNGTRLEHKLKRVRYSYDVEKWLGEER